MNNTVRTVARISNRNPRDVEKAWRRAKKYARVMGRKDNYLEVLRHFKNLVGIQDGAVSFLSGIEHTVVQTTPDHVMVEINGTTHTYPLICFI